MPRRHIAGAASAFAILALTACAHRPEIAPDRPVALVRFTSQNVLGRAVFSYDDEQCDVSSSTGSLGTTGGLTSIGESSSLGMLDTPPRSNQVFERRIPADRDFIFSWLDILGTTNVTGMPSGSTAVGCSGTFAAKLQPGAQYESRYGNAGGRCEITLSRLDRQADGSVARTPEPSFHALPRLCGQKYRP